MKFEDMNKKANSYHSFGVAEKKNYVKVCDQKLYVNDAPENINLHILQKNLENCLGIIEDEVMKGYVTKLDQLPIIKSDKEAISNLQDIHFFKITELVYQEDEFSVDKLAMVFHALSNKPCTLVLMLKSDGEKNAFYLGVRPNGSNSAGTLFQMLKQSLSGFFPGSKISEYYDENMKHDMNSLNVGCISSVTCVADYKQEQESRNNKDFIQGLEKFVYAMQGKSYTAVFIADNLGHDELMAKKREYEQIYTQISPFANMQMSFSVTDGGSLSVGNSTGSSRNKAHTQTAGDSKTETDTKSYVSGVSRNFGVTDTQTNTETLTHTDSESEANGNTHTTGTSDGISKTTTNGINVGTYSGVSVNGGLKLGPFQVGLSGNGGITQGFSHSVAKGSSHTDSVSDSVTKTLTHGFSDAYGKSYSYGSSSSKSYGINANESTSKSIGNSTNRSDAYTIGETFNLVNSKTMTDTFGASKGITLNAQNMTLNLVLQKIQKHLERIEECESFGMWNFAAYFLSETAAETETAANTYRSVIAGTDSGIERSAINSWLGEEAIDNLFPYIQNFIHPQFVYSGFSYDGERYIAVDPSVLV